MANLFEQKDRRVIPNWRSFIRTIKLGELRFSKKVYSKKNFSSLSINDYIMAWNKNKSISIAGDLVSAAFVNGFTDNEIVKEAANYIIKNKQKSTDILNSIAKCILGSNNKITEDDFIINNYKEFVISGFFNEISKFKKLVDFYPYNPIAYVELSRLYSIVGLEKKSIKNMKIALHLVPENRFILRAATRLFSHFNKFNYIHNLIRKSELVYVDPWITSTEIALATILRKKSRLIKTGINMINSNNYEWQSLTELASSIGTLEFLNGNRKKAKKYLEMALISPNDNSLAQVEWINDKDLLFEINPDSYNVKSIFEALALYKYFNNDYEEAFNQSKKWFLDLPFSKRPVIYGSHIATSLLDKPGDATILLKAGLYSHPHDPQIINNLAYSLVLENQITEAEYYMKEIDKVSDINTNTKICLTATQGLISFRKGQISDGIDLYESAIRSAKSFNNNYLIWLAKLNFARELIISSSCKNSKIDNLISKIPNNTKFPDVNKLKKEVIESQKKIR